VETHHRTSPVSFSRRGGRLGERQQRAWDELADDYVLDVPRAGPSTSVDPDFGLDLAAIYGRTAPVVLEIGSGYGETLAHAANEHPDVDFLAFEVYIPAVAQTLLHIRREGLTNIRLVVANAPEMLTTALAPASLDELRIWFPDPWHKTRHHKRRLITDDFARLAARVLPPGGTWRVATDWADYAEQIGHVLAASPDFEGGPCERFEGRPVTRFETKGLNKDRVIHDFRATRVET
jgi:tRNA (guanine-N7-)-methyltransferase